MRTTPSIAACGFVLLGLCGPALAQEAAVPDPLSEKKFTATFDFGNRWVQDIAGSTDTYRSLVDLGDGPKLFGATAAYRNPAGRLADRIDVTANSWGGDPYNGGSIEAEKSGAYSLRMDYRNVLYFNSLPSFANPLLAEGVLFSQRSFDMQRRQFDATLRVKPQSRITPFFAYSYAAGFGQGVTNFVSDGNNFPVHTDLDDLLHTVRGGAEIEFSKLSLTLEQGVTVFNDAQEIFFGAGGNRGNRRTTLFGQELILDSLRQSYDASGNGVFNRAVVQGHPWERLSFAGQFLYSQPSIEVNYQEEAAGDFFALRALAPFTNQLGSSLAEANRPHPSGSWNTEVRPTGRLRVVHSWYTDRFHVSSGAFSSQLRNTGREDETVQQSFDRLVLNYNQSQIDVIYDAGDRVTLRGGHRYVWGEAQVRQPTLLLGTGLGESGKIRRHVGLAGGVIRAGPGLSITMDFEASPGDRTFFRTGLMDYQKGKVRARYRAKPALTFSGSFSILDNQNSDPEVRFEMQSRQSSFSVYWTPGGNRRFSLLADYTRATLHSSIPIVVGPFLERQLAGYQDNGHHAGAYGEINLARNVRLSLGGSLSVNSGSRPTRYYQPQARVEGPLAGRVSWFAEWRWYGFTERRFAYENFRAHVIETGLRLHL